MNTVYSIVRTGLLVGMSIALVACSHPSTDDQSNATRTGMNAANTADAAATAYGAGSNDGFQTASTTQTQPGKHINPLRAPANQTYYFDFDSNVVHASDIRALNMQANYLSTHPAAKIRLEGNTDNRGSREYNVGLGWRRDQAVERYFTQRGVSPKQIQLVSYGKENPAVLGNSPRDWALNRRVNLIYKAK